MITKEIRYVSGIVLDETPEFGLGEVCWLCDVRAETLLEMVEHGIVAPRGPDPVAWRFGGVDVTRARRALRLRRDLQVNWSGAALALDLLDELEHARDRLRALSAGREVAGRHPGR